MNETTKIKKPSAAQIAGRRSCASVLYLTLKKKWFDMILSGEKKEEYREIKRYWISRLVNGNYDWNDNEESVKSLMPNAIKRKFDFICFKNGYSKDAPEIWCGCHGIRIGEAKPEWSDSAKGNFFIIELGQILAFPVELR